MGNTTVYSILPSPAGGLSSVSFTRRRSEADKNSRQDYDAIADEIFRLREQKEQAEADSSTQKRIAIRKTITYNRTNRRW